jgi:hypothetical protein
MVKVEKKMKKEVCLKFLPWNHVEYKSQIEEYFKIVKKLNNEGLNPKANISTQLVFDVDIAEVFGPCTHGYKTTNSPLHYETKKDLVRLYWQVYGTNQVTNDELMIWFVKGYIAHEKGHKIN